VSTNNYKQYDRVIWREGMLISPQHLQQQEQYEAQILHERLAASTPLSWGVQALEFDAGAMKSGRLEITRFDGVLPDGTDLRGKIGAPTRTIGDHFPTTAKQLEVSLGLRSCARACPTSTRSTASGAVATSRSRARSATSR
jgi:type VI secretion system protein ImpJ